MIKIFLVVAIPLALGVALAVGATSWTFKSEGDHFVEGLHAGQVASRDQDNDPDTGGRVKVINGESYDFGVMDQFNTGRHTFKVKNEGTGPLTIGLLQTSCTCTSSDMEEGKSVALRAGQIKDVTLEWEVKAYSRHFSQSATLRTSDPKRRVIRLTVEGRIDSLLSLSPDTIVFPDFSNKEAVTEFLRIFSYKYENLQCEQIRQQTPELEKYFDIEVTPMDKAEVAEIEDCKSGLFVKVTAKPGMPLGSFRQRVSLTTNVEDRTSIDFEIEGNVVGDISVWTREKYSQRKQVLSLDLIKRGTKRKAELQIFVKGEHKDKTQVTVDQSSVDPSEVLSATLGEPVEMGKSARRFPLTIEVDAGNHTISRLARDGDGNYGKVVLKTTHPDAPEIVIHVAFATGG